MGTHGAGRLVTANLSITLDGRFHGPGGPTDLAPIVPYAVTDVARDHLARIHDGATTAVLSRTRTELPHAHTVVRNEAPESVVRGLRAEEGGSILVNTSPSLLKPLLAADLVDRLFLVLCPEIAGGGERLFEDGLPSSRWRLVHLERGELGELSLTYDRSR